MKRELVLPGSLLEIGNYFKNDLTTFKIDSKIYSGFLGLYEKSASNQIHVIPLRGKYYLQKTGDKVIGIITRVHLFSWIVDINSFCNATLPFTNAIKKKTKQFITNLQKYLSVGDLIYAEITSFDKFSPPILTIAKKGLGKITSGYLLTISPAKVSRLIGKKKSMINMIREKIGIKILVGRNGRIVLKTNDTYKIELFKEIIKKIEEEAHTTGLTNRIKNLLEEKLK